MERLPLTDEDKELFKCPAVITQLPIMFETGLQLLELTGQCAGCKRLIHNDLFRGRVNTGFRGVAVVEAVGVCKQCKLVTRFLFRFKKDATYETINDQGEWVRIYLSFGVLDFLKNMFAAMRRWLRRLLSKAV